MHIVFLAIAHAMPTSPKVALANVPYADNGMTFCLPSGMLVVFSRRPGSPVATTTMVVSGGTSAESAKMRGAAHLVEHLWFRSRPDGGDSVWDQTLGLDISGSTRQDATVYSTVGAIADLSSMLVLDGKRMTDPLQGITETDVTEEREVVASELAWRGEHAERAAQRYLDAALFPADHPYAAGGATIDDTRALALDAVSQYARQAYVPANVTLRIEGDVTNEAVEQMLISALPDSAWVPLTTTCDRKVTGPPRVPPGRPDGVPLVHRAPVWDRMLYVGWTVPPGFTNDDLQGRLAAALLADVVWFRSHWTLGIGADEEAGVRCGYEPGLLASVVWCRVALPGDADPASLLQKVRSGLGSLSAADNTQRFALIGAAKPALVSDALDDMESISFEALDRRALNAHHRRAISNPLQDLVDSLSAMDLRAYFSQWITPDRMAAVALEPADLPVDLRGHEVRMRLDPSGAATWSAPRTAFDRVHTATLTNGLAVWTAQYRIVPVARTALVFSGGWGSAPEPGTNDMLDEGTRWRFPSDYYDMSNKLVPTVRLRYGSASNTQNVFGLSGNLANWMWAHRVLLDTAELDSSWMQSSLDRDVENVFDDLVRFPWLLADDLRMDHLFGSDRASTAWWERHKAARFTPVAKAEAWRKTVFRPDNGTLLVVGDVPDEVVLGDAERYLGAWTVGGAAPEAPPPTTPPRSPPRSVLVLPLASTITNIDVSCRVPVWSSSNAATASVLESTLDRVWFQSLREDAGSYGPAFSRMRNIGSTSAVLETHAEVAPGDAGSTVRLITDTLAAIAAGAPEPLVALARTDAAARWGRQTATGIGMIDALHFAADAGMKPADLAAMTAAIPKVTAMDLSAMVRGGCVGHEAVTVVGQAPVAGLEGPDVRTVDWSAEGRRLVESLK